MQERWDDIRAIWQSSPVLYGIAGFLAGILFFPALEALSTDASDLLSGFVPEAVGIAFTVLLIDRLNRNRERAREERELKDRLIRDVRSPENSIAKHAIHEIRERGWLTTNDEEALLVYTHLDEANWQNAILNCADLAFARIEDANLRHARLWNANLSYVDFAGTDLEGADLSDSLLENTRFDDANLRNVNFTGARFSENTVLPDYTKWTPETDMRRFTDPNHPDFWEPDWVKTQREQGSNND